MLNVLLIHTYVYYLMNNNVLERIGMSYPDLYKRMNRDVIML